LRQRGEGLTMARAATVLTIGLAAFATLALVTACGAEPESPYRDTPKTYGAKRKSSDSRPKPPVVPQGDGDDFGEDDLNDDDPAGDGLDDGGQAGGESDGLSDENGGDGGFLDEDGGDDAVVD